MSFSNIFSPASPAKKGDKTLQTVVVLYTLYIYLNVRFYDYFFSGNGSCFGLRLEGGGKHQTTVFKRLILKFNYLEEISTDTGKKSSKEEMEC